MVLENLKGLTYLACGEEINILSFWDFCLNLSEYCSRPALYWQYSLFLGKALTFSLIWTRLVRTLFNPKNKLLFLAKSAESHKKSTSLMRTLYWQLPFPFWRWKNLLSTQYFDVLSAKVRRIGWIVDVNFGLNFRTKQVLQRRTFLIGVVYRWAI